MLPFFCVDFLRIIGAWVRPRIEDATIFFPYYIIHIWNYKQYHAYCQVKKEPVGKIPTSYFVNTPFCTLRQAF
jgi:hypothetical protein